MNSSSNAEPNKAKTSNINLSGAVAVMAIVVMIFLGIICYLQDGQIKELAAQNTQFNDALVKTSQEVLDRGEKLQAAQDYIDALSNKLWNGAEVVNVWGSDGYKITLRLGDVACYKAHYSPVKGEGSVVEVEQAACKK